GGRVALAKQGNSWIAPIDFESSSTRYRITATHAGFAPVTKLIAVGDYSRLPVVEGAARLRRLLISMSEERLVRFQVDAPGASIQLTSPSGNLYTLKPGEAVGFPAVLGLQPYEVV